MGVLRKVLERLNDAECIFCGKEKENRVNELCNNCSPYIYEEKKKPHQQIRLTKEWKINRKERLNQANNTCEWCEKKPESGLVVHHDNHIDYYKIWFGLVNTFSEEMIEKNNVWKKEWDKAWQDAYITEMINKIKKEIDNEAKSSKVEACPHCDSSQLSVRKYKKPKYFCSNCKKEFNTVKIRPDKKYYIPLRNVEEIARRLIYQKFIKKAVKHSFDKLKEEYEEEVDEQVKNYLSMKDTEVLCKRCHMATENFMKLCPICRKKYYRIPYNSCAECYKKVGETFFVHNKS